MASPQSLHPPAVRAICGVHDLLTKRPPARSVSISFEPHQTEKSLRHRQKRWLQAVVLWCATPSENVSSTDCIMWMMRQQNLAAIYTIAQADPILVPVKPQQSIALRIIKASCPLNQSHPPRHGSRRPEVGPASHKYLFRPILDRAIDWFLEPFRAITGNQGMRAYLAQI